MGTVTTAPMLPPFGNPGPGPQHGEASSQTLIGLGAGLPGGWRDG